MLPLIVSLRRLLHQLLAMLLKIKDIYTFWLQIYMIQPQQRWLYLDIATLFKDGLIAILSVDQLRFKEKYRKPILRVFFKRGIKVTEEQIEEAATKQNSFNELYATK